MFLRSILRLQHFNEHLVSAFYLQDVRYLIEDLQELKPTMFCGVPRVYERLYTGMICIGCMHITLQLSPVLSTCYKRLTSFFSLKVLWIKFHPVVLSGRACLTMPITSMFKFLPL